MWALADGNNQGEKEFTGIFTDPLASSYVQSLVDPPADAARSPDGYHFIPVVNSWNTGSAATSPTTTISIGGAHNSKRTPGGA